MDHEAMLQLALEEIDRRITENIQAVQLAQRVNYSVYHFRRVFLELTGTPVMGYITRRKLEYALYDLSQGQRVIDVAMTYGFETHSGFTKACKRFFGYPPSLYRLHTSALPPEKASLANIRRQKGGISMEVQIKELQPLSIVGYASRHRMPGVNGLSNIPGYWETINLDYGAALSTLHWQYQNSRHCEVAICLDLDEVHDCFTYMLGVGVDASDEDLPQPPGTYRHQLPGGLYAVFTTPLVGEDQYVQSIHDTWKEILANWLPQSQYAYDSSREAYEYYDERDHGQTAQMDICIPLCKRDKER